MKKFLVKFLETSDIIINAKCFVISGRYEVVFYDENDEATHYLTGVAAVKKLK